MAEEKEDKKLSKKNMNAIVTISIVVIVVIIGILAINFQELFLGEENSDNYQNNSSLEETTKCIGKESTIYIQLGCHACKTQEEKFGKEFQHLNVVDCYKQENRQECIDKSIKYTPTWIINGKKYTGVKSISKLKELTGC